VQPIPIKNPPNPWVSTAVEYLEEIPEVKLTVYEDASKSILSKNESPDLPFRWSVNAYRGCTHGCAYCYARPTHEYLGFGAGTDFDRRIVVKRRAPALLRAALAKKSWKRESIMFSGVTDPYQPLEASLELTRGCLAAGRDAHTPVAIVSKAPLVERDIDVLTDLARVAEVRIMVSLAFWDADKSRALEPLVATPQRRLRTIARLAAAGLRVGVLAAPVIPGFNDQDVPRVLEAARDAGATSAGWVLLRLPGSTAVVFEDRLRATRPLEADRVMGRVRQTRGGAIYDPRFGVRGRGQGPYAAAIGALFTSTAARLGLISSGHYEQAM